MSSKLHSVLSCGRCVQGERVSGNSSGFGAGNFREAFEITKKYTTRKADGTTPMYWFIMAPKTKRHLCWGMAVAPSTFIAVENRPVEDGMAFPTETEDVSFSFALLVYQSDTEFNGGNWN